MQQFVIFLALFFSLTTWVRAESIALVLSDDSTPFQEFSTQFQQSLKGSNWRIVINRTPEQGKPPARYDLIVTAGADALRSVLSSNTASPILATLITEANFRTLVGKGRPSAEIAAIVLDQPVSRQARLIRLMFPEARQVGMLFGPQTLAQSDNFRSTLARYQLSLNSDTVSNEEQVVPAIDQLLGRSDLFLAHPDALVYSRNTIKPALITAYRHRRPILGFSAALTKAGALAAMFSTPGQIAEQAAKHILSKQKPEQTILLPRQFTISINQSVAGSFGLRLPEESELMQKLLAAERP